MALQLAAIPAGVLYVGGAAVIGGLAYATNPEFRRSADGLGSAMAGAAGDAVDDIASLFDGDDEESQNTPVTATDGTTQQCDGPHRGRFQAQGYRASVDPEPLERSTPWNRECIPPMRREGHRMLSQDLLVQVQSFSRASANLRYLAFVKMSDMISRSPPAGFPSGYRFGFGITAGGQVKPNLVAGRTAPRVDLEVYAGRAFGIR